MPNLCANIFEVNFKFDDSSKIKRNVSSASSVTMTSGVTTLGNVYTTYEALWLASNMHCYPHSTTRVLCDCEGYEQPRLTHGKLSQRAEL